MSHTIFFDEGFTANTRSYTLMVLPDDVQKQVEADPSMILRFVGREDQEAVMVTEDKTYAVKRGETSNAQLLFPCGLQQLLDKAAPDEDACSITSPCKGSNPGMDAVANVQTFLEISMRSPLLKELPALLQKRPYEGPDYEEEDGERRLTRSEMYMMLQASPREIDAELERLGALEVDGGLCVLATSYESNLMTNFFAGATLYGWDLKAVGIDDLAQDKDMQRFPDYVLQNFLSKYAVQGEGMNGKVCLNLQAMAMFRADELLGHLSTSQRLTVEEFIKAWGAMLPEMQLSMEMLRGMAVSEVRGAATLIKPFKVSSLSRDPKTRFKQLFEQKASWGRDEIMPYVEDLCGPGVSVDSLLMKHTRTSRSPPVAGQPEVKTYSSRI